MTFLDEHIVSKGKDAVADTTAETKSAVVDMQGTNPSDEVTFIVQFADVDAAAVMTFQVKENTANSTTSPAPTAIADAVKVITEDSGNLDNKQVVISVQRSQISKRYVFLSITATVESYEIAAITTIQGKLRSLPASQSSDVAGSLAVGG